LSIVKLGRFVGCLAWICFSTASLSAQKPVSPKEVVKAYCQLDLQGARLASSGFPELANLYAWEEEPGWDTAIIVKSFQVKSVKTNGNNATVVVEYVQLGNMAGETLTLKQGDDQISFKLKKSSGSWRIVAPVMAPHVSALAMQHHIEWLVNEEGADAAARWSKTLTGLKSLSPK
jgi:hypothetical protein